MEISLWLMMILPLLVAMFISKVTGGKTGSVLLKGSITYVVLLTALIGMEQGGGLPVGEIIVAAMATFVLADILLDLWFIPGMAVFAVGHGLLIWWMAEQGCLSMASIPIGVILYALSLFAFRRQFKSMGRLLIPFLLYPLVLMAMAGMAAVLPVLGGVEYLPFTVGALLFVVSDLLVARNVLVKLPRKWNIIAFAMYYTAIFLMALSCWSIF